MSSFFCAVSQKKLFAKHFSFKNYISSIFFSSFLQGSSNSCAAVSHCLFCVHICLCANYIWQEKEAQESDTEYIMYSDKACYLKLFPMATDAVVWYLSRRRIQRNIVFTGESFIMSKEKGCKDRLRPEILTSSDLAHQTAQLSPSPFSLIAAKIFGGIFQEMWVSKNNFCNVLNNRYIFLVSLNILFNILLTSPTGGKAIAVVTQQEKDGRRQLKMFLLL